MANTQGTNQQRQASTAASALLSGMQNRLQIHMGSHASLSPPQPAATQRPPKPKHSLVQGRMGCPTFAYA